MYTNPSTPINLILCPVCSASTSSVSIDSHHDKNIPEGIHVDNPVKRHIILRFPEHIKEPHLSSGPLLFLVLWGIPCQGFTTLLLPLPLHNIHFYNDLTFTNSIYHITISNDKPLIILN